MKKKLINTAFCLLLSVCSYSQTVLIDEESGDTLVAITLHQMDDIYIELLQKDSLSEQAQINASKELKYLQLIDSAKKDISMLKTHLHENNAALQIKTSKLTRSRKTSVVLVGIIILQILLK